MILFDTTFVIDAVYGDWGAASLANSIAAIGETPAISAITVHEYLVGVHLAYHGTDLLEAKTESAKRDLSRFKVLPFTESTASASAKIFAQLTKKGRVIGMNDVYIAATALSHDLELVSRNEKHFKQIAGLRLKAY